MIPIPLLLKKRKGLWSLQPQARETYKKCFSLQETTHVTLHCSQTFMEKKQLALAELKCKRQQQLHQLFKNHKLLHFQVDQWERESQLHTWMAIILTKVNTWWHHFGLLLDHIYVLLFTFRLMFPLLIWSDSSKVGRDVVSCINCDHDVNYIECNIMVLSTHRKRFRKDRLNHHLVLFSLHFIHFRISIVLVF